MKFNKKLMKSHSNKYRMLQIPHSIATIWIEEGITDVTVEYVEKMSYLIVRPVRGKAGTTAQTQATAQAKEGATNHLPSTHFGM